MQNSPFFITHSKKHLFFFAHLLLAFLPCAKAAETNEPLILQQQRQKALEQHLTPPTPDVKLSPPASASGRLMFPDEKPCFPISRVVLSGADALPRWIPLQRISNRAVGHCLGGKGVSLLMSELQNHLIDLGYITTRVLAPGQDLKSGQLTLVIVPGRVRNVALTPDSDRYVSPYGAFPVHSGQILN